MISKAAKATYSLRITMKLIKQFLSAKKDVEHDLIFIRHAQSQFNVACEQYRQAHNIPYVWRELCNHQGFDQTVLFNMKYIDCPITDKGRQECIKKRHLLDKDPIDCVIVSPQMRALETCDQVFKNRSIPIIVDPLLVGPLRSCSDISYSMEYKKLIFPRFNFSKTENCDELWFIENLSDEQQEICKDTFEEKGLVSPDSKRAEILNLLKQGKIGEDAIQYRKRIENLKKKIHSYKNFFRNIAIVAHYYTIEYICAKEYTKCGDPLFYLDVRNCTPYYAHTKNLRPHKVSKAEELI